MPLSLGQCPIPLLWLRVKKLLLNLDINKTSFKSDLLSLNIVKPAVNVKLSAQCEGKQPQNVDFN